MTDPTSETPAGIALVTGASRGVGRGIAQALAEAGMIVYITGRSGNRSQARFKSNPLSGTLAKTAESIRQAGGHCIPVTCDHSDDRQVKALFELIRQQHGQLDLLVNNAIALHDNLIDSGPFWQKPPELAHLLDVGLRSSYIASYYAAPLLLKSANALIVQTSSYGAGCYMHGPAYGAQKAGSDKMIADMAVDFEGTSVRCISLWLGPQKTERSAVAATIRPDAYGNIMSVGESPEFNGKVILALQQDTGRNCSGQTLISAELAQEYGITDQGNQPDSFRNQLGAPLKWHPARII